MSKIRMTSLIWTILFCFAGCSQGDEAAESAENGTSTPAADSKMADQQLSFALNVFHKMTEESPKEENVVFSPFSLYRILGAVTLGSEGKTKQELEKGMERTGSDEEWIAQMSDLCRSLEESAEVQMAGGFWIQDDFQLESDFMDRLWSVSKQEVQKIDFSASDAAKTVNKWFEKKTDGHIADLMKNISPDTRLLLADAITFHGQWKNAFDPEETRKGYFTDINGEEIRYPIMQQTATFPYYEGNGFQYLEIPYGDSRFSMAVVLPDQWDHYLEFEKNLTAAQLKEWREKAQETKLDLRFPTFSVEKTQKLETILQKMGIVEAFGGAAEFRPIAAGDQLRLAEVVQGTFLKVDEKGTEAAAGTAASFVLKSAPVTEIPRFYADRPFLYFIRQNADGAILFQGRFVNPTAMDEATKAVAKDDSQASLVSEGTGEPTTVKDEPITVKKVLENNLNTSGIGGTME